MSLSPTSATEASAPIHGVRHAAPLPGLPANACDCHVHVYGDPVRFPFFTGRRFTPPQARIEQLIEHQQALGFGRVVIVQPSVYGTDNRCTVDAIRQIGPDARGVGVIGPETTEDEIREMHAAGVRGVRINFENFGKRDPAEGGAALQAAAARIAPYGWHVQAWVRLDIVRELHDLIKALPTPVVLDHLGRVDAASGPDQPGLDVLLDLLSSGKAWVKLSGAHRISEVPDHPDVEWLVHLLLKTNPDHLVWGSDWPHSGPWPGIPYVPEGINEFHPIDDGHAINRLRRWLGSAENQKKVLVDNPARLYEF